MPQGRMSSNSSYIKELKLGKFGGLGVLWLLMKIKE
jgi:hypothetical protein